jgi:hypothetical protein
MRQSVTIRRFILGVLAAGLIAFAAPAAYAGPGQNFPEQPGDNVAAGCQAVLTNPDRAIHTVLTPEGWVVDEQHASDQAASILLQMLADACFGGP